MNKKVLSLVVILCTIVCVYLMLFMDSINLRQNTVGNKVQVFKEKVNKNAPEKQLTYEQKKDKEGKKDKENKEDEGKVSEFNSIASSEAYKKFKSEEIANQIEIDKKNFSKENENTPKDSSKEKDNKNLKEEKDTSSQESSKDNQSVSVFKISKSEIKDKMTLQDKENLLSVASKLSAVDYEKIKSYLQSGKDEDIISTIKLLKERLSDKDYNKVKEVVEKFINMDVVK